jgi:hypothetical protein
MKWRAGGRKGPHPFPLPPTMERSLLDWEALRAE